MQFYTCVMSYHLFSLNLCFHTFCTKLKFIHTFTFYMKLMTASCSMSNFLPIVIIFRQILTSEFSHLHVCHSTCLNHSLLPHIKIYVHHVMLLLFTIPSLGSVLIFSAFNSFHISYNSFTFCTIFNWPSSPISPRFI